MTDIDVVVVGAGIAGLYQLHRLRELGLTTRVFESGSDIGGTWYWNRYPGARCDVESLDYSYSFSPELEQDWEWSERYATQPEILRYLDHVARRFDLRSGITFDTTVTSAHWEGTHWRVATSGDETVAARFMIMATGCLSLPKPPDVPGVERFAGPVLVTGRWPHEPVDLTGKRVAVIGTGSSAIQSIPLIAEQAAEVTVFQRTPNYSLPARNRPLDPDEVAVRKADYPAFREAARWSGAGVTLEMPTQSALEVGEEERLARYEAGWQGGSLFGLTASYTDIRLNLDANATAAEFVRGKIRDIVDDPATAELLSPRTYPFGTKRPCLDSGYYATFNRDHVHLVDLRSTPLTEITETAVHTTAGEHPADVVVFATGFDAMTGAITAVDIRGRDGQVLRQRWADGPRSYLGLAVAGFPNLFTITGPGSPSVLSNMMVSIEQHVDWITAAIADLDEHGLTTIEARADAEAEWVEHVAEVGAQTLYPLADSWYMGANVPGKPRVFLPYIGGVGPYRERCDAVAADGYAGFDRA
jgi:cation diffusion facilitator CzcD-associated flavoprotein CzcO